MKIKTLLDEDFINYKFSPSMLIAFPNCTFKCEKDCGQKCCQNSKLAQTKNIEVGVDEIIRRYLDNKLTRAIVCGGLEPFDSWDDLFELVLGVRNAECYDPIIIYTGYKYDEIESKITILKAFRNIIVKFGRFIPNEQKHLDPVLGVELASQNQYAVKIS